MLRTAVTGAVAAATTVAGAQTSALWGVAGELWSPAGRLPDFSLAGYRRGIERFRIPTGSVSVADFGAKGDGMADDTAAFRRALAVGAGRMVTVPPGRYLLNDVLEIASGGTVLRGAGSDRSILMFRRPLQEIAPRPAMTDHGAPTTGWSWSGGLITIRGRMPDPGRQFALAAPARRGDRRLSVAGSAFEAGDEIVLVAQDDAAQSLVRYLYRGDAGNIAGLSNWIARQALRVTGRSGNVLELDRPLRFDARPEWRPRVHRFAAAVTDVGVEGLGLEFPARPYGGHFREDGYNGIAMEAGAAHCWVRDVHIRNADSGVFVSGWFCTLSGIRLSADPARTPADGATGHHGISFSGQDCLLEDFELQTKFIHDITVSRAMGCVISQGRAVDLAMDHHRWAPYENLFTDIDAGRGTRLFASSGGGHRGRHSAAGATFWNIRAARPAVLPEGFNHSILVGVALDEARSRLTPDVWREPINAGRVIPPNLFEAMRRRATGGGGAP